jgi:hypothetical protein
MLPTQVRDQTCWTWSACCPRLGQGMRIWSHGPALVYCRDGNYGEGAMQAKWELSLGAVRGFNLPEGIIAEASAAESTFRALQWSL